jgi:hypothetical protein
MTIPIKLYLWMLKFKFNMLSMCRDTVFFWFVVNYLEMQKLVLAHGLSKNGVTQPWSAGCRFLIP